jgi:hypothetical protein
MLDHELWQRYSLAGRKHVLDHFNLARQTGRLEDVFEQLLAGRQVPGGSGAREAVQDLNR